MPGQSLPGTDFKLIPNIKAEPLTYEPFASSRKRYKSSDYASKKWHDVPYPGVVLSEIDVNRWRRASRAYEDWLTFPRSPKPRDIIWSISQSISRRCSDWPVIEDIFFGRAALGLVTVALVYGGLHALAWNAHFGSATDQLLWRMSACVVMGSLPVLIFLYHFCGNYSPIFRLFIMVSILITYTLARAYLVVECFINLAHLPVEAYTNPEWSSYFPHIS